MVKQISDNKIYLLIKYTKSVLWRAVKRLSYIQDAWCLKVNIYGIPVVSYAMVFGIKMLRELLIHKRGNKKRMQKIKNFTICILHQTFLD